MTFKSKSEAMMSILKGLSGRIDTAALNISNVTMTVQEGFVVDGLVHATGKYMYVQLSNRKVLVDSYTIPFDLEEES